MSKDYFILLLTKQRMHELTNILSDYISSLESMSILDDTATNALCAAKSILLSAEERLNEVNFI